MGQLLHFLGSDAVFSAELAAQGIDVAIGLCVEGVQSLFPFPVRQFSLQDGEVEIPIPGMGQGKHPEGILFCFGGQFVYGLGDFVQGHHKIVTGHHLAQHPGRFQAVLPQGPHPVVGHGYIRRPMAPA